ncbi:hypothetical protein D9M71_352560 [compost metagenome]
MQAPGPRLGVVTFRKVEGDERGILGEPVGMQELDAGEHLHGQVQHRRVDRRGAVADALEAAQVVVGALRMLQHHLQHGRHQDDFANTLALDGLQHLQRIEIRQVDVRLVGDDPRNDEGHRRQVEHRRHMQRHGILDQRQHGHAQHWVEPHAAMGVHDALGEAGGAAGVHDHGEVLAAVPGVLHRCRLGDQPLEGMHAGRRLAVAGVDQHRLAPGAGEDAFDQRQVIVVDDQEAGVAVVQRVDDLRHAPADVHRVDRRAHPPARQHIFLVAVGVQRQHADALSAAQPKATEAGSQARDALAQFAIGFPPLAEDGGDTVGIHLHGYMQALGQVHRATSSCRRSFCGHRHFRRR